MMSPFKGSMGFTRLFITILALVGSFLTQNVEAAAAYVSSDPPIDWSNSMSDMSENNLLHNNIDSQDNVIPNNIKRGGGLIPAGYNPFGYKITALGETYLQFEGSLDSDLGRLIASLKERKTMSTLKAQWLEILRVSKSGQTMRIYKSLKEMVDFCLKAGFLN